MGKKSSWSKYLINALIRSFLNFQCTYLAIRQIRSFCKYLMRIQCKKEVGPLNFIMIWFLNLIKKYLKKMSADFLNQFYNLDKSHKYYNDDCNALYRFFLIRMFNSSIMTSAFSQVFSLSKQFSDVTQIINNIWHILM